MEKKSFLYFCRNILLLMTWEYVLRIFVAALLGGAIGLEREYRAKEAGFRTHFLVALGSALFMVLSQYGFMELLTQHADMNIRLDPSRIASQVVTGIGFIGAGTIIFQKHVVRGLTTAAGLWVTAAIGMTCGSGMYVLACSGTLLVLAALEAMNFIHARFGLRNISLVFRADSREAVDAVLQQLRKRGASFENYEMEDKSTPAHNCYVVSIEMLLLRKRYRRRINDLMQELRGVVILKIE